MGRLLEQIQANSITGEIAPGLRARIDLNQFYTAYERMRNAMPQPHGGWRRRPGLAFKSILPFTITFSDPASETAPEGGTAASATDQDQSTEVITTTLVGTVDPYVVVRYNLGSAKTIKFADVIGLKLTTGSSDEFRIQWSADDAAWNDFGAAFDAVDTTDISRRRRGPQSAQFWRVVKVGGTDGTTAVVHLDDFELWEESATVSATKLVPFRFSILERYIIAITAGNAAVYFNGNLVGDFAVPFTSAQVTKINWYQTLDTLLLFHKDIQTRSILRSGADDEWDFVKLPYTNMQQRDFGGGAEDIWSDARGWPQCGLIFEGRFYGAGSASLPDTIVAGKADGTFFNMDAGTAQDDEGFNFTLGTEEVGNIVNLFGGRHLQVFTETGEHFALPENEGITPTNIQFKNPTAVGSAGPGVRVAELEGATYYVDKKGGGLREFLFTDAEQKYQAQNIALLSSHLLSDPVSIAVRKLAKIDEGNLIYHCNDTGELTVLLTIRNQDIAGWAQWQTEGSFRSVAVDFVTTYVAVERTINGADVLYLEQFNDANRLDASLVVTAGLPTDTFAQFTHLKNTAVRVRGDDVILEDETVDSAGQVTVERAISDEVEIGLDWPDVTDDARGFGLWVKPMPFFIQTVAVPNIIGRKKRVVELDVEFLNTEGLYISANDKTAREITFREFGDDLLDDPLPVFSGEKSYVGLRGYTKTGQIEFLQKDPVDLTVLRFNRRVSL